MYVCMYVCKHVCIFLSRIYVCMYLQSDSLVVSEEVEGVDVSNLGKIEIIRLGLGLGQSCDIKGLGYRVVREYSLDFCPETIAVFAGERERRVRQNSTTTMYVCMYV